MKKQVWMYVLTVVAALLLSTTAFAADLSDLTYDIQNDGTIAITDCSESAAGALEIPAEIEGRRVTRIGEMAFFSCSSLTSVTIPEGVTSIGDDAFFCCGSLTSVTIPKSVTSIGDSVFSCCYGLMSVTIPVGVTSIGDYAFHYCSSLTSVTIPDSVTSIGDDAFSSCYGLTSVTIPKGVTSIGDFAFYNCSSLTSVTIPEGVTSIGNHAFGYCSRLTSVTIPDSVISIGEWIFSSCSSLTSVTIPKGVTSIGDYSFAGCHSLTSVTLPDSVTSIKYCAFSNCRSLTNVTIPEGMTSIGGSAFNDCSSLTSVTIPDSVTSIGHYAFSNCSSLSDVYYGGDEIAWNAIAFGYDNTPLQEAERHYNSKGPGKDPLNVQVPFGKYLFRVVDDNGTPLSGVQVTYDTQSGKTNQNGLVTFSQFTAGTPRITAKLNGYVTWTNENSSWSKSENRYETIVLYPVGLGEYRLRECRYSNASNLSFSTDLLTQTKTLSLKNTGNGIGDLDFGNFYLTCRAGDTSVVREYALWQGSTLIAACADGNFGKLSVTRFSKGGSVFVRVTSNDGKTVDTPIHLQFTDNQVNSSTGVNLMDDISIQFEDSIPFFGGSTVEIGLDLLPVDIKVSDESIYIGFNRELGDDPGSWKESVKDLKKKMNAVSRIGKTKLDKNAAKALKKLAKSDQDFALPGGKFKATVIGYAEASWGSTEAKGEIYILLEAETKDFGFNTVVYVVPVTVSAKATAEFQAGCEIIYNWSQNQLDGGLKLELKIGVKAFGGVGFTSEAANLRVGAYGQADVDVDGQLLGTQPGVHTVDLSGELGIEATVGPFSWTRPFAHNTWHLYARNSVRALNLGQEAVLSGLYDAGRYEVVSLDYLRNESDWLGESIHLMMADAKTDLKPLLQSTYRNALPAMIQTDRAIYAAFLRGNAETGAVSVWVTRFDGTSWADPVQADSSAILDDAPVLCGDAAGNIWLAYARTRESVGDSLLTYAKNQSIVVGKIDPDTLAFTEEAAYTGQGYVHMQQLVMVNDQPVLVWADSQLTDADSVLFPQSNRIDTATCVNGTWSGKTPAAQVERPIWQLTAGELDDTLVLAYIQDGDGNPDTKDDRALYQLGGGETREIAADAQGNITFGTIPGQRAPGFIWNAQDALCSQSGSVTVPGITNEYALVGDSIYFSTASDGGADLVVMNYHRNGQAGDWGAPIQLTDGKRYLENLSVVSWNGNDYVLGMHTHAQIGESVETDKNLVWAVVQPVSDLRLESVSYDVDAVAAGEEVAVTLTVGNAGDHVVSGVDISYGESTTTFDCTLHPGKSMTIDVTMLCPAVCTEYPISVSESGAAQDDYTPEDNEYLLKIGYADVAVELTCEQVGNSRRAIAVLTNQGVETASGTLYFTDGDGREIGTESFADLATGQMLVFILPLETDFSGTVDVRAESEQEEFYTYNNTAYQSVVHMGDPTSIRSLIISETGITAQIFSAEDAGGTAFCALYDEIGKLLEVTSSAFSQGEHTVSFTATVPFDHAKVFLLNADHMPLCASELK